MNHKQKLSYTLLGAGILAVGIVIGQVVSPFILTKGGDRKFRRLECESLRVTTGNGGEVFISSSDGDEDGSSGIMFRNEWGDVMFMASSGNWGTMISAQRQRLHEKDGKLSVIPTDPTNLPKESGFMMLTSSDYTTITLNEWDGKPAIQMSTSNRVTGLGNQVIIYDKAGNPYMWNAP